jgi:hypothetical protein
LAENTAKLRAAGIARAAKHVLTISRDQALRVSGRIGRPPTVIAGGTGSCVANPGSLSTARRLR